MRYRSTVRITPVFMHSGESPLLITISNFSQASILEDSTPPNLNFSKEDKRFMCSLSLSILSCYLVIDDGSSFRCTAVSFIFPPPHRKKEEEISALAFYSVCTVLRCCMHNRHQKDSTAVLILTLWRCVVHFTAGCKTTLHFSTCCIRQWQSEIGGQRTGDMLTS